MKAIWQGLESLFREVERAFAEARRRFPREVRCRPGCDDCCYALFDLSLAEAALLQRDFRRLPRRRRREILRRLERYEREWERKKPPLVTPFVLSVVKIRCPLLSDERRCELYEARPATCRLYGIPVEIEGETFVCGHSGFEPGRNYPTVLFGRVQERLAQLSESIAPGGGRLRVSLSAALRGRFPGVEFLA